MDNLSQDQLYLEASSLARYKKTELGTLPVEWQVSNVSDVVDVTDYVANGSFQSLRHNVTYRRTPDHAILVRLADYNARWRGDFIYVDKSSFEFLKKSTLLPGDIVVANVGSPGSVFRVPDLGKPMTLGPNAVLCKLKDEQRLLQDFFYYFLISAEGQASIASIVSGSSQQKFNKTDFRRQWVPLPPPYEQQAITYVLRGVQKAIEATEEIIEATRELKRSLMYHFFTYGPVPVDEADQVPLKQVEIGSMPEHWDLVRLGEVANIKGSTSKLSQLESKSAERGEPSTLVLSLKVSDMNLPINRKFVSQAASYTYILARELDRLSLVPPNATILPKRGAAIATNKKRITTTFSVLDPNLLAIVPGSRVQSEFLFAWFEQFDLRTITDQTTLPQLNKKDVEPLLIPVPSRSEQETIARTLALVDQKHEVEESRKASLKGLFRSLLHNLMTGKVRVNDLDLSEVEGGV